MQKILVWHTTKSMAYLKEKAKILPASQQVALSLMISVFLHRNSIPKSQRSRFLADKGLSFLKFQLDVDLKRVAQLLYPDGSVKRPREAKADWIARFKQEAQNLCANVDGIAGIRLDGDVLYFLFDPKFGRSLYTVQMPSPLEVPVTLMRMPDSRICQHAFVVNLTLLWDKKMNRSGAVSYMFKIWSLLALTGLESLDSWNQHDKHHTGPKEWFTRCVQRAVEGYDLFAVNADLDQPKKGIAKNSNMQITTRFSFDSEGCN